MKNADSAKTAPFILCNNQLLLLNIFYFIVYLFVFLYTFLLISSMFLSFDLFQFCTVVQVFNLLCHLPSYLLSILSIVLNPIYPRVSLSDHASGGEEGAHSASPPSVNPDSKMLLTWNLTQSYFAMLQKNSRKYFSKLQL